MLISARGASGQRAAAGGTSMGGAELRLTTPAEEIRIDGRPDGAA